MPLKNIVLPYEFQIHFQSNIINDKTSLQFQDNGLGTPANVIPALVNKVFS
jgi:hypothetical protein